MQSYRSSWILFALIASSLSCGDSGVNDPEPVATGLRFSVEPTRVTSGSRIEPPVTVLIVDSDGRTVGESTERVQIAILPGAGTDGAALSGLLAKDAENGLARFDDLTIGSPGDGFQLLATAPGLGSDTSRVFDVDPRASRSLAFVVEPSSIAVGEAMSVEVAQLDADGRVVEGGDADVFLVLAGGEDSDARLVSPPSVVAVDGVARFPEITVSNEGRGYTLTANASSPEDPATLISGTSAPFDVGPWRGSPTSVTLISEEGDFIGQGRSYSYDQSNAVFSTSTARDRFPFHVRGDERWSGDFRLTDDRPLSAGRYTIPDEAEARWGGEGRGCDVGTGVLVVDSVTYVGEVITRATLLFEQSCAGSPAALRGSLHYDRHDTTVPPGPIRPIPGDLWVPGPEFTEPVGSYVHLASEEGDFVGAGATATYVPTEATIQATFTEGELSITVNDQAGDQWTGQFVPMNSIEVMEEGYYPDLRRYPFHNPAKGGLGWSGNGRGCNRLTGWFSVDELASSGGGGVSALHLRFEQFCDGSPAALRGVIHLESG